MVKSTFWISLRNSSQKIFYGQKHPFWGPFLNFQKCEKRLFLAVFVHFVRKFTHREIFFPKEKKLSGAKIFSHTNMVLKKMSVRLSVCYLVRNVQKIKHQAFIFIGLIDQGTHRRYFCLELLTPYFRKILIFKIYKFIIKISSK